MALATLPSESTARLRRPRAHAQAGQSLLIALAILFLLGFLGALFSSIVVRNLSSAQSANETINTDYFAQAGINYANTMLETSPQGADWRPPLQYTDSADLYVTNASSNSANTALAAPDGRDPDSKWLSAGFTRYNLNGGRFLIKVTYDPNFLSTYNASDPAVAKYLRIDSIGRLGTIDSEDPTSYTQNPPDFRRSELVAYKPIGIVDYSRFITNKDNRTDTANLGVPSISTSSGNVVTPGVLDIDPSQVPLTGTGPFGPTEYPLVTYYGSAAGYTNSSGTIAGGGSLRSNMNLRLYGENNVYLNPTYGDDWEVAGNLVFDNYSAMTASTNYSQLPAQMTVTTPTTAGKDIYPSNDTTNMFTTDSGVVRDGNTGNDQSGYARQIKRLNPPLIDTVDPVTGLTRYQELTTTLTSTNGQAVPANNEIQPEMTPNGTDYVPATININNNSDIQTESINTIGGHTLRNDWLNHASDTGGSWEGSFYNPPGTVITFGPVSGISNNPYGITLTRSDVDSSGAIVQWTSPTSSTASTQVGQTLYLSYAAPPAGATANPNTSSQGYLNVDNATATTSSTSTIPNDVVIYASGNVRIRGIISDPTNTNVAQHITIVTNGIAYIDGSVLKGNANSSIAILAKQYVCVNTTQFLAGAANLDSSVTSVSGSIGPPPALTFSNAETLTEEGLYGAPYGAPYSGAASPNYALYVSQSAGATSEQSLGEVSESNGPPVLGTTYTSNPIGLFSAGTPPYQMPLSGTTTIRDVYSLNGVALPNVSYPGPNIPFDLTFSKNPDYSGDWLLQKAAVLPGDIHIEAVLYAQDNSFFVIPGDWFNTDANDTLSNAYNRASTDPETLDDRYPFYGQPIDLQVTIDGAVSENVPADISDEAAWMRKWGWIPRYHGSDTSEISPHAYQPPGGTLKIGIGLNLTYDPHAGYPYNSGYLRQDRFGRPLPFAPALPVSPDLLYSGQPSS